IIDTAGTMVKAADAFKKEGATSVIALGTHAVFSGLAYEKIEKSQIDEVIVTDTIPPKQNSPKIKILSVAPLFAEVIRRINNNESVNSLFT
ncbi:MAG: ribose-phosphate pyrophosphokinase, partial [Helicobacter sp.]|nr:ribose-phosphate pyrophosphokinase [Helicobacter sp.]